MSEKLSFNKNGQWVLEKSSKNAVKHQTVDEDTQLIRLVRLAQNMGLKPKYVNSVADSGPKDRAFSRLPDDHTTLHYDGFFGHPVRSLRHELAHRMLVPEGKTFKQHSLDLTDLLESGSPDKAKKAWEHENAVSHAGNFLDRVAGIKPSEPTTYADADFNSQEYGNYKGVKSRKDSKLSPELDNSIANSKKLAQNAFNDHINGHVKFNEKGILTRIKAKI